MSLYEEQNKIKPKIEDIAGNFLDVEKTAAILELVQFIRAIKVGIQYASGNSWSMSYKNKRVGYLKITRYNDGNWKFCHNRDYLNNYYNMEECDFKTFIFDNIYARTCGDCQENPNAQKAGYMNPTKCTCYPLRIFNPVGETLEYTKMLIEYRKNCILEDYKKSH